VWGQTSNGRWCLSVVVVVCRRHRLSSVTLPAGGLAGRQARGRSGGRHCTTGQYGNVPLWRYLVFDSRYTAVSLEPLRFTWAIYVMVANLMTIGETLAEIWQFNS